MDDRGTRSGGVIPRKRRLKGWRKGLLWTTAILLAVAITLFSAAAYYLHRAAPTLRAALIDTLQKRFNARVELDTFNVSVLDGFLVEAGGLRIWLPAATQAELAAQDQQAIQEFAADAAKERAKKIKSPPRHQELSQTIGAPLDWQTQPWITADKLRFHVSWRILPGRPIIVSLVHVDGVRVLLPPKGERPRLSNSDTNPNAPESVTAATNPTPAGQSPAKTESVPAGIAPIPPPQPIVNPQPQQSAQASNQSASNQSGNPAKPSLFKMPRIVVRQVEADNVDLILEKGQRDRAIGKIPLAFVLAALHLTPDGRGGPIAFSVDMTNPKPIGTIHSSGHFGPIATKNPDGTSAKFDPGALPVSGNYSFDHADLSTIKGIAGILSSTGNYSGVLRRIEAQGTTNTPDFRLERVGGGVGIPLTTRFHAIVDGTNGDTYLSPVDATLGHTHFVARGKVVRVPDVRGHDIQLQVVMDRGRIEDILRISTTADKPFLTGKLTMDTSFHLPPGDKKVFDKLELNGKFHLSEARFGDEKMQGRIEQLSLRGQGKPKDIKTTDPASVLSDMQGHFKLGDGKLATPDLDYQVPGAEILVQGTYGLDGGTLDYQGNARMDATISQMVGGWKGLLLKPVDRYLKRNGAATDVPIRLQGTRKAPQFGVEFNRVGKADAGTNPNPSAATTPAPGSKPKPKPDPKQK